MCLKFGLNSSIAPEECIVLRAPSLERVDVTSLALNFCEKLYRRVHWRKSQQLHNYNRIVYSFHVDSVCWRCWTLLTNVGAIVICHSNNGIMRFVCSRNFFVFLLATILSSEKLAIVWELQAKTGKKYQEMVVFSTFLYFCTRRSIFFGYKCSTIAEVDSFNFVFLSVWKFQIVLEIWPCDKKANNSLN